MGTLTGNTPVLSEHCPHKLPSSCRLTALPICCACQDTRAHSGFYKVYIDGVGYISRGTRWQRYCFFCREFWSNRLAATDPPIEPNHTRIPEIPDQTDFLEKWFDYHRGYKISKEEGTEGVEQKIEMKPEVPWRDVEPGTLPIKDDIERLAKIRHVPVVRQDQQGASESIESALDALLGEAESEDAVSRRHLAQAAQTPPPTAPVRRGPTEADILAAQHAKDRLEEADRVLSDVQALHLRLTQELQAAEEQLKERQHDRRIALQESRGAQQLLRVLGAQGRSTERDTQRFVRVWGTMDDIRAHGSPLTNLFNKAYARYEVAEEVRAEERASDEMTERQRELLARLGPWSNRITDADYAAELDAPREAQEKQQSLDDEESNRPPPRTDEEMTVPLICKICLQQPANMAVLPCGHLTMCQFCADVYMPIKGDDDSRLVRKVPCPLPYCKKAVKRRVKIYIS